MRQLRNRQYKIMMRKRISSHLRCLLIGWMLLSVFISVGEALVSDDLKQAVVDIQKILDTYCLAGVNINPESRVKVKLKLELNV